MRQGTALNALGLDYLELNLLLSGRLGASLGSSKIDPGLFLIVVSPACIRTTERLEV